MRLFKLSLAFMAISAQAEVIFFYIFKQSLIINFEENQTNAGQFSVPGDRARRAWKTIQSWFYGPKKDACEYIEKTDLYLSKVFKFDRVHFP